MRHVDTGKILLSYSPNTTLLVARQADSIWVRLDDKLQLYMASIAQNKIDNYTSIDNIDKYTYLYKNQSLVTYSPTRKRPLVGLPNQGITPLI